MSLRESISGGERSERSSLVESSNLSRISIEFQSRKLAIEAEKRKKKKAENNRDEGQQTVTQTKKPRPLAAKPEESAEYKSDQLKHSEVDFHQVPLDTLAQRLNADLKTGLSAKAAQDRLAQDGPNVISPKQQNIFLRIGGYIFGGFNILLYVCSFMCWISWEPLGEPNPSLLNLGLAVILIVVALISTFFTWFQEHQSNQVMKSIGRLIPQDATVMRDEVLFTEKCANIVCGDILSLKGGDRVPADCRLFNIKGLKVDQSILTGESEPVSKTEKCSDDNYLHTKNIAFMGTNIVEGNSLGIVVAVGNESVMGSITQTTSRASVGLTYLQIQVRRLIYILTTLMIITAAVVVLDWAFYLRVKHPGFENVPSLIINVIGVMVSYIPEGLPACLVLALTVVAKKMYQKNVLVKRLPIMETLGSVDIIASDKTGTLTQNLMSVTTLFLENRLAVGGLENDLLNEKSKSEHVKIMIRSMCLCNGARFDEADASDSASDSEEKKIIGDATDTAFLRFSSNNSNVQTTRSEYPKIFEIPFNSKNKWMLTIHDLPDSVKSKKEVLIIMKGAAEMLLKRATSVMTANGEVRKLEKADRKKIKNAMTHMAEHGERVLGLCLKHTPVSKKFPVYKPEFNADDFDIPMDEMTFVGLAGLIDPPRPDVPAAVATLKEAGIRVMMVTGDHPVTATAIAEQVGIIENDREYIRHVVVEKIPDIVLEEQNADRKFSLVIVGQEIPNLVDSHWEWILEHDEIIFARTSPENKFTIVKSCQDYGHVVGVTGDGVNDAPALKQADCGIAMGAGSDVARDAADLVLVTNSFSSILTGIENGRLVFDNLTKVILYVFPAGQFSEIVPVLVNSFFGLPTPLSAYLMIYICCITDVGPALSLIHETGESDLMKRKPRSPNLHLVRGSLFLLSFGFFGVIECTCAFVMYFMYYENYCGMKPSDLLFVFDNYTEGFMNQTQDFLNNCTNTGSSVFFVALVVTQWFNLFSTRTQRKSFFQHNPFYGPAKNPYLFLAVFGSLCFAVFTIYAPFMNSVFGTAPVPVEFWFAPMIFGVLLFMLDEVRKLIIRMWIASKQGVAPLDELKSELKYVTTKN